MGQNKSTHIANKYKSTIYAKCDSERRRYGTTKIEGELEVGANLNGSGMSKDIKENKVEDTKGTEEKTINNSEHSSKKSEEKKDTSGHFVAGANANAKMNVKTDITYNRIEPGFVRILPGKWARFDVDCAGTDIVYITIQDEKGEFLCNNLAKRQDMSVFVDEQGQVMDTKYGNLFVPA